MRPPRNRALWLRQGPAHRVILAFGGTRRLAEILGLSPATVTRWIYPREVRGCGGLIPSAQIMKILAAAEAYGVEITDAMLAPRFEAPIPVEELV